MPGIEYSLAYFGAVAAAAALTPIAIYFAKTAGVVDLPNARNVHKSPTPRIGGLAIAGATLATAISVLLCFNVFGQPGVVGATPVITILAASFFILLVGFADDLVNVPARFKLLALIAASVAVCSSGALITEIGFGGNAKLHIGIFSWPVTILWIIGVTVAVNFIDGLDGLASGLVAIAAGVLAIVAALNGNTVIATLTLSLLGALTGFLFYNFNPARVFMGDCGSMFIGFMLASCSVLCTARIGTTAGILLPALTLAIPLVDALLTFVRRTVLQRRSIFSAERGHIHHRLIDLGLCHRHVAYVLFAVSAVGGGVGLIGLFGGRMSLVAGLSFYGLLLFGLFRISGSVRIRDTVSAIRRNRAISRETRRFDSAFEESQLRFRNVTDVASWWHEVCAAAEDLHLASVTLPLLNRDGSDRILKWRRTDSLFENASTVHASLPLAHRRTGAPLRLQVDIPVVNCLESAGRRIALFARLMNEHSLASLPDSTRQSLPDSDIQELTPADETLPIGGVGLDIPLSVTALVEANVRRLESSLFPHKTPASPTAPRIAIVHDFLYVYAGAEKVLEQILEVYPTADLFSLFDFLPADQRAFIKNKTVHTSFLQRMPFARSRHRAYLPLMPIAIEQLDLSPYDIIISSSYVVAKGVLTRPGQLHICYCHTPVRFAWDLQRQYLNQQAGLLRTVKSILARILLHYIRQWDLNSASRVDLFVTNSDFVGSRIEKTYRRQSTTIYPPVDISGYTLSEKREDYYLTASRLVSYKRIDLIIEAFNQMPAKRLIVVGEGPELEKYRAAAGPNVRLVGYQSFENLRRYMQLARAFVFAAEEDFGITPVEAQACGTPIIAYGRGGACESIIEGVTGLFFHEQTAQSLIEAISRFESHDWNPVAIRRNAIRFSPARFRTELRALVERAWTDRRQVIRQIVPAALWSDSEDSSSSDSETHGQDARATGCQSTSNVGTPEAV